MGGRARESTAGEAVSEGRVVEEPLLEGRLLDGRQDQVGLIPAAGLGTRAYPYTATIPKGLLEVDGKPVLQHNLELLRDEVGVSEVVIVIGYLGEIIKKTFGDGSALRLRIEYVQNDDLELGLAHSLRLAGRVIAPRGQEAICLLSDEIYVGCDHRQLRKRRSEGALAACGVLSTDLIQQIRRNYSVERDGSRIVQVVEKPRVILNRTLGTGTYCITPELFRRLDERFDQRGPAPDWMGFLGELVAEGEPVEAIDLGGRYANVNNRDELARANLLVRNHHFDEKRVSVVLVVDREEACAGDVMRRFAKAEGVHELLVVLRRSNSVLKKLPDVPMGRIEYAEDDESFGDMTRRGLDAASGDILVLAQSDDNFSPDDLPKLLTYARDADLVVGTRTTRQMIEQGSNMRGVVRFAHLFLAKLTEILWWGRAPRLTDQGCVYRAVWRSTWRLIRPHVVRQGQEIYPEMLLEVLRARRRVIEIPVNYYNRDPSNKRVSSPHQTLRTFWNIFGLIVSRSVRNLLRR